MVFLALGCFACKMFQVNQQTKSGKWKCRMCGEGQSIVKVWGRGGHAKDVRGLVMELNATAGRGEDPQTVLRRALGGPGPHPQPTNSLSQQRPPSLDHRRVPRFGTRGRDAAGRELSFSSNTAPLRFAEGADELRSLGQASRRARSGGFVPAAGLAPDGFGGDATVAAGGSWGSGADSTGQKLLRFGDERRGAAAARLEDALAAGGVGFEARRGEHAGAHPAPPSAWQQTSVRPAGSGGRGGSRWGAFASGRAAQGLGRHRGPDQQAEGDPTFVTSLEEVAPARSGKKRGRHEEGNPAEEEPGMSAAASRSHWNDGGAASAGHAETGEQQQHPCRQKSSDKSRRLGWSSSSAPRADQVGEPPTASGWGGSAGFRREDSVGPAAQGGGCGSSGGGMSKGMFSGESNGSGSGGSRARGAGGAGATGSAASSSSSRWGKFL